MNQREILLELEKAEREYVVAFLEKENTMESKKLAGAIEKGGSLPFYWRVHFEKVFSTKNKGFDIVICNPPYVPVQALVSNYNEKLKVWRKQYKAMAKRSNDLYLAFVEQALELTGKSGRFAYIMPNFSRTASGELLRKLLSKNSTIDLWVDFRDIQVFESASNYVSLLYGNSNKLRRTTFACRIINEEIWPPESNIGWIEQAPVGQVKMDKIWRTWTRDEKRIIRKMEKNSTPLGGLAKQIGVGIQTSKDEVYLIEKVEKLDANLLQSYSKALKRNVKLENKLIYPIAKGSKNTSSFSVELDVWVIFPYDDNYQLLSRKMLEKECPLTWAYLKRCERVLRKRERGRFNDDQWWRFGRHTQGVRLCRNSKIIVPSIMNEATACNDEKGKICITASGEGGGGAYGIIVDETQVKSRWVLAVLNSKTLWENWLLIEGSPQRGGWRGIDKALLSRIPIPVPNLDVQEEVADLTIQIENSIKEKKPYDKYDNLVEELNSIVQKAYFG